MNQINEGNGKMIADVANRNVEHEKEKGPQTVAAVSAQETEDTMDNIAANRGNTSRAQAILAVIPADLAYNDWFRIAAGLKNEGVSFEVFDKWSQSASEKYDAEKALQVWEDAGKDGAERITIGTLKFIAARYDGTIVPPPERMMNVPETQEEMVRQAAEFADQHYHSGEFFELCTTVTEKGKGKKSPDRFNGKLMNSDGAEITVEGLKLWSALIAESKDGAWCSLNPVRMDYKGKVPADIDVTDFRYTLIEADDDSRENQWKQLCRLELPIHSVVWSGGKSLHAVVKIDAGTDPALYKARVKLLHEFLEARGFNADRANKNPSRLTRMPGFRRGDDVQYLIAKAFGPKDWETFERMVLIQTPEEPSTPAALNGKDISALTKYVVSRIGENNLHRIDQQWWRYKQNRWVMIGSCELRATIVRLLQSSEASADGSPINISGSLISNIIEGMNGMLFLDPDHFHVPCFMPGGANAERWICFNNVLVNVDDLAVKLPSQCETRKRSNQFFGVQDVDFNFDPDADCPKWRASLEKILPDPEIRKTFQQVCGYALSRSTKLNKFAICFGPAGTGKSSCLEILRHLVGEKNCAAIPLHDLGGKYYGSELTEKWLNAVEELVDDNRGLPHAENFLKTATSGGMIKVEKKFENVDKGKCRAFNLFCCNTLPTFSDRSKGLWDRIILIPFENVFRGSADQNKDIVSEWLAELPGIFNWAMEGLRELANEESFPLPTVLKELIQRERDRCDVEGSFVRDALQKNPYDYISCPQLLQKYREYTDQLGVPTLSNGTLYAALFQNYTFARKSHTSLMGQDVQIIRGVSWRHAEIPFPVCPSPITPDAQNGEALDKGA